MTRVLSQRDFDRFAALSRDDNPIHCDPRFARGTHFGATVAHGMFLYGLVCGELTRRLGAPWLPVAQTLMFPAPTFAGDAVSVRVGDGAARGVHAVAVEVERDGCVVQTAVGESVVARIDQGAPITAGRAGDDGGKPPGSTICDAEAGAEAGSANGPANGPANGAAKGEAKGAAADEGVTLHGLACGQRAQASRVFEPADLDEYADLCGDADPLVVDEAAARRAGLPARIVPGPLLAGMFSDLLGTRLPGRGTGWMKQSLRFARPVHPGELLQATVEIVRLRPDKKLVDLRSTVRDARGALVVDGAALVLVRNLAPAAGARWAATE